MDGYGSKFVEGEGEWKVVEGIKSKRILFWDDSSIVLPNKNNKRISIIMINISLSSAYNK